MFPFATNKEIGVNRMEREEEEMVLHTVRQWICGWPWLKEVIYEGVRGEWTNTWKKNAADTLQ